MPMFHSQTAIAYNPALVPNPPKTYEELVAWVKENPGQFGYNGIKGGMSGVSFVMGWMYAFTDDAQQLMNGPYDERDHATIGTRRWPISSEFNKNVVFTPGNAGTLDMLNRGELAMGPVWIDMFYTWQSDGRLNPDLKITLIGPGMPGQPMYYVVPAKAPNRELAEEVRRARDRARTCRQKASSSASTGIPASTRSTSGPSSTRPPGTNCSWT